MGGDLAKGSGGDATGGAGELALKVREFTVTDAILTFNSASQGVNDPAGALPERAVIVGMELTLDTAPTGTPSGVHASYGVVVADDILGTTDDVAFPSVGASWAGASGLKAGSAGARSGMLPLSTLNLGVGRQPKVEITVDSNFISDILTFSITARIIYYEVDELPVPSAPIF